jgi:hypothetical protein
VKTGVLGVYEVCRFTSESLWELDQVPISLIPASISVLSHPASSFGMLKSVLLDLGI